MADIEISNEAIAAQQAYDATDAEVQKLIADGHDAGLDAARAARLAALHVLRAARAELSGQPVKVEQALRAAARQS